MTEFSIGNRKISSSESPFVIAELSGNHNGKLDNALKLIDAAHTAGADAIKLQTYTADTMTIRSDRPEFTIQGGPWNGKTLFDLYEWAHTPWEWHEKLFSHAKDLGLIAFSSPFDETAVDFLESLNVPAYKIASFELMDWDLIDKVISTDKPVILSTGMASMDEIQRTYEHLNSLNFKNYALLYCVSGYPTPVNEINLNTIKSYLAKFKCNIGLSDHTLSTTTSICSVALGCSIIEKHITLDRSLGGPDAQFSLEPNEFKTLCDDIKMAHSALGSEEKLVKSSEKGNLLFRRSIYVVEDMSEGEVFTEKNIKKIRPSLGLNPADYKQVLGKKSKCNIKSGTPLSADFIQSET